MLSKTRLMPKPGGGFTLERFEVKLVLVGIADAVACWWNDRICEVELGDRPLSSNADETKEVRSRKVSLGMIKMSEGIASLIVRVMR